MRDRQPVDNVAQNEVFEATCSSAQVPSNAMTIDIATPPPAPIVTPVFIPQPSTLNMNNVPQQPAAGK